MKTPTPLTDEQIWKRIPHSECNDVTEVHEVARAREATRDAQWVEMLAGQEPVGEVINHVGDVDYISYVPDHGTKLYTHPQTDDTALLKQALEALQYVDAQDNDRDFLHSDEWCRLDAAIAALQARLK